MVSNHSVHNEHDDMTAAVEEERVEENVPNVVDANASAETGEVEESAEEPAQAEDEPAEAEAGAEAEAAPAEAEASAEPEDEPAEAEAEPVEAEASAEAETSADEPAEAHPMEALLEEYDEGEPPIRRGDIVEGEVAQVAPTEILIDVGAKSEGIISGRELEQMDRESIESLAPGQKVTVYILHPEGSGGAPVLSLSRAQEEQDWRDAEVYYENKTVYEGSISGYNKGGLIVRFGRVRGFVPASQISIDRRRRSSGSTPHERWGEMVGEEIMVKVVEVDRSRNRLILSEREATKEWRKKRKEELLDELRVGEVRRGRVISIADFGVFVDLGGADGLVHLTELTWKHVTHPKEVVKIGQEVEVKVISVDKGRKRIGLSMKQLEKDPWEEFDQTHRVGQLVQGKVTKLTKFGAFAQVVEAEGIEGLIHISELSDSRVGHPREVVSVGDVLTLRVVKFDLQQRRLGLSIKEVNSPRYSDMDWQMTYQEIDSTEDDAPTIGDMVGYDPEG